MHLQDNILLVSQSINVCPMATILWTKEPPRELQFLLHLVELNTILLQKWDTLHESVAQPNIFLDKKW